MREIIGLIAGKENNTVNSSVNCLKLSLVSLYRTSCGSSIASTSHAVCF